MNLYGNLVTMYDQFLGIFPPAIQWLVTLALLVGLAAAFVSLIRHNALFLILLVVLLPFVAPILGHFFTDLYNFFLYLVHQLGATTPSQ